MSEYSISSFTKHLTIFHCSILSVTTIPALCSSVQAVTISAPPITLLPSSAQVIKKKLHIIQAIRKKQ